MEVEIVRGEGEVTILVRGEIDVASGPVLWEDLADVIPGAKRLVIDLRDVVFIDSSGLSVFVRVFRRLREGGGDLVLRSPRPKVRERLGITGLDQVLTIEA